MAITAPYNFVPLSKFVYFPDWADQVSHDIPFEDGISGELICELTTQTPVYVRNGVPPKGGTGIHNDPHSFFNVDGQYIIPGTSLKGMLRNVIEIATFGKMCRVDNHRYSVRDLKNKDKSLYVDWMTETLRERQGAIPPLYKSRVGAGWLNLDANGGWIITPCKYARVDQIDLIKYRKTAVLPFVDLKKKQTSLQKYSGWGRSNLLIKFELIVKDYPHSCGELQYAKASRLGAGSITGTLVFTGQPSDNGVQVTLTNLPVGVTVQQIESVAKKRFIECRTNGRQYSLCCKGVMTDGQRDSLLALSVDLTFQAAITKLYDASWRDNKAKTKHMEFIFYDDQDVTSVIPVDFDTVMKDFIFIHSLSNGNPNEEWGDWCKRQKDGSHSHGVPVFYRMDGRKLLSIGLAQMYKLPYEYTIRDVVRNSSEKHFCDKMPDFAEILFGYVGEKKNGGQLKGRISIASAIGSNCQPFSVPFTTVLGAPKPTYYPSYLEQPEPTVRYRTFMDPNPSQPEADRVVPHVRGWKRYPARLNETVISPPPPPNSNIDVCTTFTPLQPKAVFPFTIKLHNLKPTELGAILWALEWGGNKCFRHSLGMGKPFGYGLVTISVDRAQSKLRYVNGNNESSVSITDVALTAFYVCMKSGIASDWAETPQLAQLLAMADPKTLDETKQRTQLKQMELRQFAQNKGDSERGILPQALDPHIPFNGTADEVRFCEALSEDKFGDGSAPSVQSNQITLPSVESLAQLGARFNKGRK